MRIASFFVLLGSAPFEDASAQWRKRARKDEPRSQTPIACTPQGCAPVAPGPASWPPREPSLRRVGAQG